MLKPRLFFALSALGIAMAAHAVTCTYEINDATKKTCTITGWTGSAPSGTWTLPSSASIDGVTYTINRVASHALDKLTEVTQINIPASIVWFGESSDNLSGLENFYGCPKLQKFAVNADNANFASDDDGCMISKSKLHLVRVPQALPVTANTFSSKYHWIAPEAFAENSTIGTLELFANTVFYENPGFNTMKGLSKFQLQGSTGNLKVENDMIYSKDGAILKFCPPRKMISSLPLSSSVTEIGDYALAGCIYLGSFSAMPTQTLKIGKAAFAGSGLQSIVIGENFSFSDQGYTFYGCSSLTSITFNGDISVIPSHFAANCAKLSTVQYRKGKPGQLYSGAFKNCIALSNYPFSASYNCQGDSAFSNIAATEVIYDDAAPYNNQILNSGRWTFSDCGKITKIDMSKIDITDRVYSVNYRFAYNCPFLKEVYLPRCTNFSYTHPGEEFYFGNPSNLDKIALGSFSSFNKEPVFIYSGSKTFEPTIYVRPDLQGRGQYNSIADAFQLKNGASLKPTFFLESMTPPDFYLYSGATYWVPALAQDNYAQVKSVNGVVKQMFTLSVIRQNDHVAFFITSALPDRIKINNISVNGFLWRDPEAKIYETNIIPANLETIIINYEVDGLPYINTYKGDQFFTTGIEDVAAEIESTVAPRYFDLQGREVANPSNGQLYIVRRGANVTKEIF